MASAGDDFPLVCETCLGPNPFVKMTKLPPNYKLCKFSQLPFQAFRWKAGPAGRFKETIISQLVARERNICQCCLNDLQYGLPVGMRDQLLEEEGKKGQLRVTSSTSMPALRHHYQQVQKSQQLLAEDDDDAGGIWASAASTSQSLAAKQLTNFSQQFYGNNNNNTDYSKTALRNLPKLCSFWLNGSCNRVLRKTCPFRPCCGAFVFPEILRSNKEVHQKLVDRLNAEGAAAVMKSLDGETRTAIQQALKGNREESIKKRVAGEDDLSKSYLNKLKETTSQRLQPPADPDVVTLWLGNITDDINEVDIQGVIYPYGLFKSVRIARNSRSAFVEYVDRSTAEYAAAYLSTGLSIKGQSIPVNWAKPKPSQANSDPSAKESNQFLPAPPGMESAPVHSYALPNMARPVIAEPVLFTPNIQHFGNTDEPQAKRQRKAATEVNAELCAGKAAALDYLASYDDDEDQ